MDLDALDTLGILTKLHREDEKVADGVSQVLPDIAKAVDLVVNGMRQGGRLFYVGCGTSGRLAVCDAAECPPTFGTDPEQIQVIMAGGEDAVFRAVEGSEDDTGASVEELHRRKVASPDVVIGIAASGRTPFVLSALRECQRMGVATIGICNNKNAMMRQYSDICIEAQVGPEAVMGSTRLKAGTAQKMILNMISTASMVKMGKVYGNLMVDLRPTNQKLVQRSHRIISLAAEVTLERAAELFEASGRNCKTAIVMHLLQVDRAAAEVMLRENDGFVRKTVETV